ncbi:MAG: kinase [Alphaproteobacteria bacterium]
MIISRTPFRISLFGGGTDYPAWFSQHGGAVIGTTIDKYCYISVRRLPPFFEYRHRIVYSKIELVHALAEIQHPAVRGVLSEMGVEQGLEIHHDADLPARSGLGSSSSFTVGLLNALYALRGHMVAKLELARQAIHVEQDVLKEAVGCQDQVWAAYGGFNRIDFLPGGSFQVTPVVLPPDRRAELHRSMMMFFTGFPRDASVIAREQIDNVGRSAGQLTAMRAMVDRALEILRDERSSIRELGALMKESWRLKRELAAAVSTPAIDEIHDAAIAAGALGGKLLGAGGGGFILFLVEPGKQARVRERLKHLIEVSFAFEQEGSKIALYQPNGL